mmetsp:Transcript_10179/g.11825  ORF Transcript_10179/g.11825 Transcript_10179/m.11825 type:complete len:138 (-) Transcript_10179:252-665(-)
MMKIVVKDNQWSDSLFQLGCFFVALAAAQSSICGFMIHVLAKHPASGGFFTAFTLFAFAILWMIIGVCSFILSGFMKCREENHVSVARKLNHRFPQLHFTIKKKKVRGCPIERGWQLVVEKRDEETATVGIETTQSV